MNQASLLDAIRRAMEEPAASDDSVTTTELVNAIAEQTGRSTIGRLREEVKAILVQLQKAGRVERVKTQRVSEVDGRRARVTAYRPIAA